MSKLYIVKYYGGEWDDFFEVIVFGTFNKKTAIEYTKKFNRLLKKWKKYYSQFIDKKESFYNYKPLKPEYEIYDKRWHQIKDIKKCIYYELPFRK